MDVATALTIVASHYQGRKGKKEAKGKRRKKGGSKRHKGRHKKHKSKHKH